MEWNAENVLDALNDFERKADITPILDEYLQRIAQNGEIVFPWSKLKPLLKRKLDVVLDEFYETCPVETSVPVPNFETFNFDNLKKSILQAVEAFTSAPFTIQRLCELVTNPQKHYNRTDKYMRGIEKNVLVVSTIEPRNQGDGNGNIPIVNGIPESDALNGELHENETTANPPNHVLLENFANVFPSAACIPTASNICIDQEVDTNFNGSEESTEVEPSTVDSTEQIQESKEELMDTGEDTTSSSDESFKDSVTSDDVEPIEDSKENSLEIPKGDSEEKLEKSPEVESVAEIDLTSDADISVELDSDLCDEDSVSANEDSKNEADISEDNSETLTSLEESTTSSECEQQDVTPSQSDTSELPQVTQSDESADKDNAETDAVSIECESEVSPSVTSVSTEQSMELENVTSSEQVPV